jgi:hypothetical protein
MPLERPEVPLGEPLTSVAIGEVQLPDFQRECKWDSDRIASLIASVAQGHPVGLVLTLEVGGECVHFAPKDLAVLLTTDLVEPERLLPDVHQRVFGKCKLPPGGPQFDNAYACMRENDKERRCLLTT